MTDDKQKIKDDFKNIAKSDIDAMFDKTLSKKEVDSVVFQEINSALKNATAANDISSELMEGVIDTAGKLKQAESEVGDLKRIVQLKDELDMAA